MSGFSVGFTLVSTGICPFSLSLGSRSLPLKVSVSFGECCLCVRNSTKVKATNAKKMKNISALKRFSEEISAEIKKPNEPTAISVKVTISRISCQSAIYTRLKIKSCRWSCERLRDTQIFEYPKHILQPIVKPRNTKRNIFSLWNSCRLRLC